jgi:BNR/Asp-box repeat.
MNVTDTKKLNRCVCFIAAVIMACIFAGDLVSCDLNNSAASDIDDDTTTNNTTKETTPVVTTVSTETTTENIEDTEDTATDVLYALDSPFTLIDEGTNFDIEAFAAYLGSFIDDNVKQYYNSGTKLTARITQLSVTNGTGENETMCYIGLNGLELHSGDISYGFNRGTLCGCELWFFSYGRSEPTKFNFLDSVFNNDAELHPHYEPTGNTYEDYTPIVDAQNRLLLVKTGQPVIVTPSLYYGGAYNVGDFLKYVFYSYGDTNQILLVTKQSSFFDEIPYAYKSLDGGITWSASKLDVTPVTTTNYFAPENIVISQIDDINYMIMLCTNRAEAFVFKSTDMGQTFQRICNFKMLNYRIASLKSGGFVAPGNIGFMCFAALDNKPNPNIYMTSDGGYNWELMKIKPPKNSSYDEDWQAVGGVPYLDGAPLSEGTSIVIPITVDGKTYLYKSTDNGVTWDYVIK